MVQKQVQKVCQFQILDNHGVLNCTYNDGSIGLCCFKLCPRRLWQMRRILNQAFNGSLKIHCGFNPVLMKLRLNGKKRWLKC